LLELIRAKKAGHKAPKAKAAPKPSNVVNLFDALKKSLSSDSGPSKPSSQAKAKPATKSAKAKSVAPKRKSA
ncbi:Ku protein, partial [Mesorhizobium sp. M2D.F.Ca.ET.140.01.1.1]